MAFTACGSDTDNGEGTNREFRGAESGMTSAYLLSRSAATGAADVRRPSAALGAYVSSYLAQGVFVRVNSALLGIAAQQRLIAGQNVPTAGETFTLLSELATLLQVNIPDMLNRSPDRAKALNDYVRSLRATGEVAEQKYNELQTRREQLEERRREERNIARDLEREINQDFRNENYSAAAEKQEDASTAEAALSQTEVEIDQTRDIIRRYEDMLEIADKRLEAIVRNREVLVAGLKVIEVPSIESLDILEDGPRTRRERGDVFGTEYLDQ